MLSRFAILSVGLRYNRLVEVLHSGPARDQVHCDRIDKSEQLGRGIALIAQVDLSRMHGVVAHDPHDGAEGVFRAPVDRDVGAVAN